MDIGFLLIVGALVLAIPLVLFFGVVALAILIWSWRRIGPYFVNLGRWAADWRNFIPLSCVGLVGVLLLILLAAVLPSMLRIPILIVLILGAVLFIIFAAIVWTIRFLHWFWPHYRVRFWKVLQWFWDLAWKGIPGQLERRMPGGPSQVRRPPPKQPVPTRPTRGEAAAVQSGTGTPGSPQAGARRPPARKSWLDLEWLWGLIWGKPEQPSARSTQKKAATTKVSAPQTAAPVSPEQSTGKPKAGLRPLTWRLGLLAARVRSMVMGQPKKKVASERGGAQTSSKQEAIKPVQAPVQISGVPQAKKEPKRAKKSPFASMGDMFYDGIDRVREWSASLAGLFSRKPKSRAATAPASKSSSTASISEGAKSVGKGAIGAIEAVRKTFWVGLFWIADRGRASIDFVRRLLRLDKK